MLIFLSLLRDGQASADLHHHSPEHYFCFPGMGGHLWICTAAALFVRFSGTLGCWLGWTAMISEKAERSQFLLFLRKNRQTESCVGHFSEGTGAPEPSFRFSVMRGRQQIRIAVA